MLDVDFVIEVHDAIIAEIGGLPGLAGGGRGGVESALYRVQMHAEYGLLDDVFGIAGLYAEAIARGHVFNDGNKRTALTCALTYLEDEGFSIPKIESMDDIMVLLADGEISASDFSDFLYTAWKVSGWLRGGETK